MVVERTVTLFLPNEVPCVNVLSMRSSFVRDIFPESVESFSHTICFKLDTQVSLKETFDFTFGRPALGSCQAVPPPSSRMHVPL